MSSLFAGPSGSLLFVAWLLLEKIAVQLHCGQAPCDRRLDGERQLFVQVADFWAWRSLLTMPSSHGGGYVVDATMVADRRRLIRLVRERRDANGQRHSQWQTVDFTMASDAPSIQRLQRRVTTALTTISSTANVSSPAIEVWRRRWNDDGGGGGDSGDGNDNLSLSTLDIDSSIFKCKEFLTYSMSKADRSANDGHSSDVRPRPAVDRKAIRRSLSDEPRSKRSYLIYPGTNWCGRGNVAQYASNFGSKSQEDKCCKQHDLCPYFIAAFSRRYNMFNCRLHTLSHCGCDHLFLTESETTRRLSPNVGHPHFVVHHCQLGRKHK